MRKTTIGRGVFAAAVVGVCVVGFHAAASTTEAKVAAKPCPKIYAPVVCDNGKTYANQCLADRANATGCVPIGVLP